MNVRFCKGSNFSTVKTRKFSGNLRVFTVFPYLFPGEVPSMLGLLQANLSPLLAAMLKTKINVENTPMQSYLRNRFQDGENTRASSFLV